MKNIFTVTLFLLFRLTLGEETSLNIEGFVEGSKLFSTSIYNEILKYADDNFLVSPFSVEALLALAQSGAKNITAEEIRKILHLPNTKEETESTIKNVLSLLHNNAYTLQTVNKIYVEEDFPIGNEFKKVASESYEAQFENIKFSQNVKAAQEINEWVADETNNKIQNLITPEDLDENTKVLLLNTLYFQGNWSTPFDASKTTKKNFYRSSHSEIETEMMFIESVKTNYAEDEELDVQILELTLKGSASIIFVLPNQKEDINILKEQPYFLLNTPKFNEEYVQILLPKFKIESSIDFSDILKNLGIHAAFDPTESDFSGIAGQKGDLNLGKVVQKTFIDVNEFGVEAAAATGGTIVGPAPPPASPTKFFLADHPFLFYLQVNGIILFEGRVLSPK